MTFWNDSYQSELKSIDLWIDKNIRYNDVIDLPPELDTTVS